MLLLGFRERFGCYGSSLQPHDFVKIKLVTEGVFHWFAMFFLNFLVLRVALAGSGRYTVCERFGRFERSL